MLILKPQSSLYRSLNPILSLNYCTQKFVERYLNKLKKPVEDIKSTSTKVCEQIARVLQEESNRLKEHHNSMA